MTSKRAIWAERLSACERSGLSRAKWCASNGINPNTMSYWCRQLRKAEKPSTPDASSLVPVVVAPAPVVDAGTVEMIFPGGLMLRWPVNANPATVARWARALTSC